MSTKGPEAHQAVYDALEKLGLPMATAKSLFVCIFYGTASLLLGLMNKALLSSYEYNGYFTLLAVQMGMSWAMCVYSRDQMGNPFQVPAYDRNTHRLGATVGILYVCNVGAGLIGLQMVNIPMFFCIRRLVTPTVLIYEYFALGKVADPTIQAAVAAIMLGTIVAGWDTLNSDILGYSITMLNNFLTAAATVAQKQFNEATRAGAFGVLYYNACTATPLSAVLAIVTGELTALPTFKYAYDPAFWFAFAVATALGPMLTYSSMLCTTYNSPLATSVTGNVKDLAQTILGATLFPGFVATAKTITGLVLSFLGAGTYSYVNLAKGIAAKAAQVSSAAAAPAIPSKDSGEAGAPVAAEAGAGNGPQEVDMGEDERARLTGRNSMGVRR